MPKDSKIGAKSIATTRSSLLKGGFELQALHGTNKKQGVYFVVNSGGNSNKDITRYNAFFVESDTLTIAEQNEKLNSSPLPPSIRVETNKSVHAYWLINGVCNSQEWREIQKQLIDYFDGDKAIINLARVMRLPFFNHVRCDENAGQYECESVVEKTDERVN